MGTQSQIQLYNEALLLVGANEISSVTEETNNATLCNRFFESARDYVSVNSRWNSVQSEAELTASSTIPTVSEKWLKKAELPNDPYCLRVLDAYVNGISVDYEVVGRFLYSNDLPLDIRYISRITDLSSISPGLFQSIALYLAYKISYPVTRDLQSVKDIYSLYQDHVREARMLDAHEGTPITIEADSLTEDRVR